MEYSTAEAISILERTPGVVAALLHGLSHNWVHNNEGGESWTPYDIIGHFIQGEKKDWIPRAQIILSDSEEKTFEPFDRFAQFEASKGKSLDDLLDEFALLRARNIELLRQFDTSDTALARKGIHPAFGTVTLRELLSTWVVHDLGHIAQISRTMAKQYKTEVGPWVNYLPVLTR